MKLTTPIDVAATVAAYWNDQTVPAMNKVQLIKFGRTLDLDQTKSLLEKVRVGIRSFRPVAADPYQLVLRPLNASRNISQ